MKKLLFAVVTLFLISSCIELEEPEFNGIEDIKIAKLENHKLGIQLGIKVLNPNFFSIKIKPSTVDIFVEDQLIGKAFLDDKIKLIRKKEDIYFAKIRVDLEDGSMMKFFKFALQDKVQLRVKGAVKGSVYGISKKITIDKTSMISGAQFKLDQLFN